MLQETEALWVRQALLVTQDTLVLQASQVDRVRLVQVEHQVPKETKEIREHREEMERVAPQDHQVLMGMMVTLEEEDLRGDRDQKESRD